MVSRRKKRVKFLWFICVSRAYSEERGFGKDNGKEKSIFMRITILERILLLAGVIATQCLLSFFAERGFGAEMQTQMDKYTGWENFPCSFFVTGGYIKGDTTYHISYYEGASGVESELEFPLDNYLLKIEVSLRYKKSNDGQDKANLTIGWFTNIGSYAGKLKDSDWLSDDLDISLVGSAHPGKDIYSESDASLKANIIDANLLYNFYFTQNITVGGIIGYRHQRFEYDVSNADQIGYGPYYPYFTVYVPGPVLDYEVEYDIPYLGLNTNLLCGQEFELNLRAAFSPWTYVHDRDDHILRYKLSKGSCRGSAFFISINADWRFSSGLLRIGGEYTNIDTQGTQYQEFYAGEWKGESFTVNDEITSSFWVVFIGVGCNF